MVDDEMVILNTDSGEYFGLDEMGALMWQHFSQDDSIQETFERISAIYEVESEQLQNDIFTFIQKLENAGLIQIKAI